MRRAAWLVVLFARGASQEAGPASFRRTVIEVGGSPWALAAADVTNDGAVDLVVANPPGGRLAVLAGDGRPDAATANYGDGTVTVLLTR